MTKLQIYRRTENIAIPEIEKDEPLKRVIKHLKRCELNEWSTLEEIEKFSAYEPTLNPMQILEISKYMKLLEKNIEKIKYLNTLIQKSYDSGNNNFIIDNEQESDLAKKLSGTPENMLKIKILSNTGTYLGIKSNYCHITAEQNVQETGQNLTNCFVEIKQNLEMLALHSSYDSTFKIRGGIKSIWSAGDYKNITLILNPEQYKKCEWIKHNPHITLEVLEE